MEDPADLRAPQRLRWELGYIVGVFTDRAAPPVRGLLWRALSGPLPWF
jgi:hypothetical protein